jgi:hypothetical protein
LKQEASTGGVRPHPSVRYHDAHRHGRKDQKRSVELHGVTTQGISSGLMETVTIREDLKMRTKVSCDEQIEVRGAIGVDSTHSSPL